MRRRLSLAAVVLLLLPTSVCAGEVEQGFESFLRKLQDSPEAERAALVDEYLSNAAGPVTDGTSAWFLYRDDSADKVSVAGDFNGWDKDADPMTKVPGTGLFYLHKEFETEARLDYKFVVNGSAWILDPVNPSQVTGGYGPNSEIAMPGYRQPIEIIADPDIPHGRVITHSFPSKLTESSRKILVYLPDGYDEAGERVYPVLFVHDGREYASLGGMVNTTDNLIASGEIEPLVIVFIDPVERNSEYKEGGLFTKMIITEVIPWVEDNYLVEKKPELRGMMGASLGGLISVHITWNYPGQFGFCASQSGAFYPRYTDIVAVVEAGPPRNIRYYLDWGTYELEIAESNEMMVDAIQRGGHELRWNIYPEGHSWGNWRAHTDDILRAFVGRK